MTRPIHFHIDEVVLRGVRPEDAHSVVAALERGLVSHAEHLTTSDISIRPRAETSRRLDTLTVPTQAPADLGEALARSVAETVDGRRGPR